MPCMPKMQDAFFGVSQGGEIMKGNWNDFGIGTLRSDNNYELLTIGRTFRRPSKRRYAKN